MLNLIKAAAGCKAESLMGKYLAKAELRLDGCNGEARAEITINKSSLSVIKSECKGSWLRLYVMTGRSNDTGSSPKRIMRNVCGAEEIVFSKEMVEEYLKLSGDTNIIHTGDNPVVPGLMILYKLLHHKDIEANARFYIPVYADEKLWVKREEKCITVYSVNGIAVKINIRS